MADMMEFPETFDEFVISYGFIDAKKVYTNGSHLIPVFRVKQWLEHISAKTQMVDKSNFDEEQYKTDLQSAYDCGYNKALSENKGDLISRADTLKAFGLSEKTRKYGGDHSGYNSMMLYEIQDTIEDMESVSAVPMSVIEDIKTEIQKEENIWYHDCEHDFSKDFDVIRVDTVLEIIDKHISGKENE